MFGLGACTSYHKPNYSSAVGQAVDVDCRNGDIMVRYYAELLSKRVNEAKFETDYDRALRHQIVRIQTKCGI